MPAAARLTHKRWFRRTWCVAFDDDAAHTIAYDGRGLFYESVSVDGARVARRRGEGLRNWGMTHGYRFHVDGDGDVIHSVALSVAIPWWCEALPLRDLSFVRLEIDGQPVYEEGRPPRRKLRWTTAERAFPIVPSPPGFSAGDMPKFRV